MRERLFIDEPALPRFLDRLVAAGIGEAVTLSTDERIDVIALHDRPGEAAAQITQLLADQAGLEVEALRDQIYVLEGEEALRHVFSVTAAVDGLSIGEPRILGRLEAAQEHARRHGMLGPDLAAVLEAARRAAERVWAETGLGARPISIAAAAVQLANDIHGDLGRCAGLALGPGDMGELLAKRLLEAGLGQLVITGRSATALEQASSRLHCEMIPMDTLEDALTEADIVIASVGIGAKLITAPVAEAALKRRRRRPVFLIDAATPRDIDVAVGDLDGAFLYDLNDLERVVLESRAERGQAANAARDIIEAEAVAYLRGEAAAEPMPALDALRRHFESVAAEVLAEHGGADAGTATRLLIERLVGEAERTLAGMSAGAGQDERAAAQALLLRLYRIGGRGPAD